MRDQHRSGRRTIGLGQSEHLLASHCGRHHFLTMFGRDQHVFTVPSFDVSVFYLAWKFVGMIIIIITGIITWIVVAFLIFVDLMSMFW